MEEEKIWFCLVENDMYQDIRVEYNNVANMAQCLFTSIRQGRGCSARVEAMTYTKDGVVGGGGNSCVPKFRQNALIFQQSLSTYQFCLI